MNLTNKQLRQLIKEELHNILTEGHEDAARAVAALKAKVSGAEAGGRMRRIGSRLKGAMHGAGEETGKEISLSVRLTMIEKRLDKLEGAGTVGEKKYWQP